MEKLKIIHVIYAGLGGHGNVLFPLLESDFGTKLTHEVVFYGVEKTLPDYEQKCRALGISFRSILKKRGQYLQPFAKFKHFISESKPDRIIVHSSELIIPAINYRKKKPNCRVYYVEHEQNQSKGFSLRFLSKYALKRADSVICLSENYKTELETLYTCRVPITVIPNGINTEKFKLSEKVKTSPFQVGMASRMVEGKDHTTLLNAFKQALEKHPDIILKIAGDGKTRTAVEALSHALGLDDKVQFLGLLDEEKMIEFYAEIDLYILATHFETMSTGLLQAMSCGLPVVTSSIKNNMALIEDGKTGWLYTDKQSDDLAEKINVILSNLQLAEQVGKTARQFVIDTYSTKKMSKNYTDLMQA